MICWYGGYGSSSIVVEYFVSKIINLVMQNLDMFSFVDIQFVCFLILYEWGCCNVVCVYIYFGFVVCMVQMYRFVYYYNFINELDQFQMEEFFCCIFWFIYILDCFLISSLGCYLVLIYFDV